MTATATNGTDGITLNAPLSIVCPSILSEQLSVGEKNILVCHFCNGIINPELLNGSGFLMTTTC